MLLLACAPGAIFTSQTGRSCVFGCWDHAYAAKSSVPVRRTTKVNRRKRKFGRRIMVHSLLEDNLMENNLRAHEPASEIGLMPRTLYLRLERCQWIFGRERVLPRSPALGQI